MDTLIQNYIEKLNMVSSIPENGSLTSYNETFTIYKEDFFSWCKRKYHGDGRPKILSSLKILYKNVISTSDHMMETNSFHISLLESLYEGLNSSVIGLNHMCGHYADTDSFVIAISTIKNTMINPQLRKMVEYIKKNDIKYIIEQNKKHIKNEK